MQLERALSESWFFLPAVLITSLFLGKYEGPVYEEVSSSVFRAEAVVLRDVGRAPVLLFNGRTRSTRALLCEAALVSDA